MCEFTDTTGRTWTLRVTYAAAKSLRAAGVVDLLGADVAGAVAKAIYDLDVMGQVIWRLIARQAAEYEVSEEAFVDSLDGPTIAQSREVLQAALLDFFRGLHPQALPAIEKTFQKVTALQSRAVNAVIQHLEMDDLDQQLDREVATLLSRQSSSPPPASSESTPTPAPPAN